MEKKQWNIGVVNNVAKNSKAGLAEKVGIFFVPARALDYFIAATVNQFIPMDTSFCGNQGTILQTLGGLLMNIESMQKKGLEENFAKAKSYIT